MNRNEAIEIVKNNWPNGRYQLTEALETLIPELKESEDEKIRNTLIDLFKNRLTYYGTEKLKDLKVDDILAWLEKQGKQKPLYIRFGDVPSNETSKIYRGEVEIGEENGVSVYPAFEVNGNIVLGLTLPITKTTLYTQQHLLEYDNRPCYLVSGDYVGEGTDGEPLIRNITIIKRLDNYRIKNFEKQGERKPTDYTKSNEEKAKEIAENNSLYVNSDDLSKTDECYIAAMEMAKWKDEQFKVMVHIEHDTFKERMKGE